MSMWVFLLLLRKNALVTRRSYGWTLAEIALPITIGIVLFCFQVEIKSERAPADDFTLTFSSAECPMLSILYVNKATNELEIEKLLGKATSGNNTRMSSLEEMKQKLIKGPYPSFGVIFESLRGTYLSYSAYTIQNYTDHHYFYTRRFSTEMDSFALRPVLVQYHTPEFKSFYLCISTSLQDKVLNTTSIHRLKFQYLSKSRYSDTQLTTSLTLLPYVLMLVLAPVCMSTSFFIGSEKESGIKDYLVVIGVGKPVMLLSHVVFSLFKASISASAIVLALLNNFPTGSHQLIILSSFLYCAGVVLIGVICGVIAKATKEAVTWSLLVYATFVYISFMAPPIHQWSTTVIAYQFNVFVCYNYIIQTVETYSIRGAVAGWKARKYKDISSPQELETFMLVDIVIMSVAALIMDNISENFCRNQFRGSRRKNLDDLLELSQKLSEYEDDDGEKKANVDVVVEGVSKVWDSDPSSVVALRNVHLNAYRGEVLVLLGRNDSGKTTLLDVISGSMKPTTGRIGIRGVSTEKSPSACRSMIGYCRASTDFFHELTVEDHLWFFYLLKRGCSGFWREEAAELMALLGNGKLSEKMVGTLSRSNQRKLSVAIAFIGRSPVVLLDGPTFGMDANSKRLTENLIHRSKQDRCILLTTHEMYEAESVGDRICIMCRGQAICIGTSQRLKERKDRYAPGYTLHVLLEENFSTEEVALIVKEITECVSQAAVGKTTGNELQFEIPRGEYRKFPQLFAKLENANLNIRCIGLSTNSFEEVFSKVADRALHKSEKRSPAEVIDNLSEVHGIPDSSFSRIPEGRFVVFDPFNNTRYYESLERKFLFSSAMKNIKVERILSHDYNSYWSMESPWVVGGVVIGNSSSGYNMTQGNLLWLIPLYLNHGDLSVFQVASAVEVEQAIIFISSALTLILGIRIDLATHLISVRSRGEIIIHLQSLLLYMASVVLTCSFADLLVKERVTHFRHQQNLAGVSFATHWLSTLLFDCFIVIVVTLCMMGIMFLYNIRVEEGFVIMFLTFGITSLPMVYFFSATINNHMEAENVIIFYQLLTGLGFYLLSLAGSRGKLTDVEQSVQQERKYLKSRPANLKLSVVKLTKFFGRECVLKSTTYGVRNEECFGLVGPSGSGKTTTFEIITGLRSASYGRVKIYGPDSRNRIMGFCPQADVLPSYLTCRQILAFMAASNGYRYPRKRADGSLREMNMTSKANVLFSKCSIGHRRKVSIAVALLSRSKLLILDEPTAGLDPKASRDIWNLLSAERRKGRTILIAPHSMEECEALCSRIGVLYHGRLIAVDAVQALKSKYGNHLIFEISMEAPENKEEIVEAVQGSFPNAELIEISGSASSCLKWKIPFSPKEKLSEIFEKIEELSLPIREFTLTQPFLDDVLSNVLRYCRSKAKKN